MLGAIGMLYDNLSAARNWVADPVSDRAINDVFRGFAVAMGSALIGFCALVTLHLRATLGPPGLRGLALAWGLLVGLMSLLRADGPWIEPSGYFRVFTECMSPGA